MKTLNEETAMFVYCIEAQYGGDIVNINSVETHQKVKDWTKLFTPYVARVMNYKSKPGARMNISHWYFIPIKVKVFTNNQHFMLALENKMVD